MINTEIKGNTIQATVTSQLRKMILTYEIKPGERLVQDDLANHLGTSRTPIREAIRQLEIEGLVTNSPYKGATVSVTTAEELEGIYQIRIALEAHATRLAVRNINNKHMHMLTKLVDDMWKFSKDEPEQALASNHKFYNHFYQIAKQPHLFDLIMVYINKSWRFRQQYFYVDAFVHHSAHYHKRLLDLIEKRDEHALTDLVTEELRSVLASLLEAFTEKNVETMQERWKEVQHPY